LVNNNVDNVVKCISPGDSLFDDVFNASDIIINVTPVGMSTVDKSLPFGKQYNFRPEQLVYDVIYSPRKTPLLEDAERAGCKIRNGFGMLVNQGTLAFEIWSGKTVPKEFLSDLLKEMDKLEEF
jgi:shikimate dehydrogenase